MMTAWVAIFAAYKLKTTNYEINPIRPRLHALHFQLKRPKPIAHPIQ
tara:strand:+ start:336 stop:476 length:141 start_codon:yes stop_codon:yes gene_type:complete